MYSAHLSHSTHSSLSFLRARIHWTSSTLYRGYRSNISATAYPRAYDLTRGYDYQQSGRKDNRSTALTCNLNECPIAQQLFNQEHPGISSRKSHISSIEDWREAPRSNGDECNLSTTSHR